MPLLDYYRNTSLDEPDPLTHLNVLKVLKDIDQYASPYNHPKHSAQAVRPQQTPLLVKIQAQIPYQIQKNAFALYHKKNSRNMSIKKKVNP